MKHLLNGVAIVAALMVAAPAWAQTTTAPMTPSSRAAPSASTAAPMEPVASARRHKVRTHKTTRTGRHTVMRRGTGSSDNIANQLNSQELGRVGGSVPPGGSSLRGGWNEPSYGQPSPTQGIPGAGQPSASSHALTGPGPAYEPGQFQPSPSPNAPAQMR